MKYTKKLIPLTLCLVLCNINLQAQRSGRGGDPIEMANKQTQQMTDSLTLSTAQVTKVSEVNLKYANKMTEFIKAARESEDFDRTTMREQMRKMRGEQNAELQTFLTKNQWAKFEAMEEARQEKREGRKGGKRKKSRI